MVLLKKRKLVKVGNSQAFFVPVEHTHERTGNGLMIGEEYDIEIRTRDFNNEE